MLRLKQYFQYRIQFEGKWATAAGIFAGLSFFLRCIYYFVITDLSSCSVAGLVFLCIIPLLISAGFLVLLKCLRYNAPGIFGILGAVLCMVIIIGSFTSGDILTVVFSIIWYLVAGALFLGTAAGYLPDKVFSVITLLIAVFIRLMGSFAALQGAASGLSGILQTAGNLLPDISTTAMLLSLLCFLVCLQPWSNIEE